MRSVKEHTLIDQEARSAFIEEFDQNFSVIAPAGVGKTTAIVSRILHLARTKPKALENLVVVTYTQKAALEMQTRAYDAISSTNLPESTLKSFSQSFFGTIHSFCAQIIRAHGHLIGVTPNFEVVTQDDQHWEKFLNTEGALENLSVSPLINLPALLPQARSFGLNWKIDKPNQYEKNSSLDIVLNFPETGRSAQNIKVGKELLRNWLETSGPIPEFTLGGKDFQEAWQDALEPFWHQANEEGLYTLQEIAKRYYNFRVHNASLTYDDLIYCAHKLCTQHSIEEDPLRVILDEAQDTDAQQFEILTALAKDQQTQKLLPGHFSMVGDPQQAIYSSRAELPTYIKLHNELTQTSQAHPLAFEVTMRCDKEVVEHLNTIFPSILRERSGSDQIPFVELAPGPNAKQGSVSVHKISRAQEELTNLQEKETYEAQQLAQWIRHLGLKGFQANNWSEIAILTPRRQWLNAIKNHLEGAGLKVQLHSTDNHQGSNPAFAWASALICSLADPRDSFELYGVLQQIFNLSDHDIGLYCNKYFDKNLHPLNLLYSGKDESEVGKTITLLHELYNNTHQKSLYDQVFELFRAAQLHERLKQLPEANNVNIDSTLAGVLQEAASFERSRKAIHDYAKVLKENYQAQETQELTIDSDAIQLCTCHKAKGLEWNTIIVPFLFRPIQFPSNPYPQLYPFKSNPTLATINHRAKHTADARLDKLRTEELERLLYVTATRARHNLIWVDDADLFEDKSFNSFADLLQIKTQQANHAHWKTLSNFIPEQSSKVFETIEPAQTANPINALPSTQTLLTYIEHTRNHLRKATATESNPIAKNETNDDSSANPLAYGIWWHETAQSAPWTKGQKDLVDHFNCALHSCPEKDRGSNETDLLLASSINSFLINKKILTETPYLYKDRDTIHEGTIDIVLIDPTQKEAIIIDWKTSSHEDLKHLYTPQLQAYSKALSATLPNLEKIQSFIYSTTTGELLEVK